MQAFETFRVLTGRRVSRELPMGTLAADARVLYIPSIHSTKSATLRRRRDDLGLRLPDGLKVGKEEELLVLIQM